MKRGKLSKRPKWIEWRINPCEFHIKMLLTVELFQCTVQPDNGSKKKVSWST